MKVTSRLRQAIAAGKLIVPGVPDPLTGLLARQVGFEVIYHSGGSTSTHSFGLPDIGLVTATEMIEQARRIAEATELPVISDADTGYGNALNVIRTVRDFERAGIAGIHIEDQTFPKRCGHVRGKRVIPIDEMVLKIRAACEARRDPDFVIIARIDARAVEGFEATVERGKAYVEAGADVIFPEALTSEEEFREFARRVDAPALLANMTDFGVTPYLPAERLWQLGYQIVLFPVSVLRIQLGAARRFLQELKATGTQVHSLDAMLTRAELYDLVGYDRYTELENRYLPEGGVAPIDRS